MFHNLSSISTDLASVVHVGTQLRLYHVYTQAYSTEDLFAPSRNEENGRVQTESTTREDHFLFVTQNGLDAEGRSYEVAVVAIELAIYYTRSTVMVYVSKADSSGHKLAVSSSERTTSTGVLFSTILEAFVQITSTHQIGTTRKVVLSLCAKSQNQYLFPGSIENDAKHVLDDRALIKWWARVLDKTMRAVETKVRTSLATSSSISEHNFDHRGYLVVPGGDRNEIRRHLLPRSTSEGPPWENRYPVEDLVHDYDAKTPVRRLIPRFPDDPKTRLWHDLEENDRNGSNTAWQTVRNLDSFWDDHLAYRKESCAGRFVGFMWAIFRWAAKSSAVITQSDSAHQTLSPATQHGDIMPDPGNTRNDLDKPPHAANPEAAIVTAANYEALVSFTQDTDFAGSKAAAGSTAEWIAKVKELAGISDFGVLVLGKFDPISTPDHDGTRQNGIAVQQNQVAEPVVTMLTGRRQKKRKAAVTGELEILDKKQRIDQDDGKTKHSDLGPIPDSQTSDGLGKIIQSDHSAREASDTNLLVEMVSLTDQGDEGGKLKPSTA